LTKKQPFGIYEGDPVIHSNQIVEKLRKAAKVAAETAEFSLTLKDKIGMTGDEADALIHDFIISKNAYPTPIGFMNFPKSVCISTNEVLCHGIPNKRPFQDGDYVNYDISVFIDGVHGDNSVMVEYGNVHPDIQKLIKVTQEALYESIKVCKPGAYFRDIGEVCEDIAKKNGYYSCKLITAHGIGPLLHMPPMIPHFRTHMPYKMSPGNVFTIEPIFMMKDVKAPHVWEDDFTLVAPGNPSAQWEHTVLITENGYEVLTKRSNENGVF